jgi:hypothetical protein
MSYTAPAPDITIRLATASDSETLRRLAGRDSSAVPAQPVLMAEVAGELRAAISLAEGTVVADPFHRTSELVEMLRIRARGASTAPQASVLKFERPRRNRVAFRSAA